MFVNDLTPPRVESTASFIQGLSALVDGGISYSVEQLALRYLINASDCPLCGACAGFMCITFGAQNLRRTHMERLEVTPLERRLAVEWALREHQRQCLEDES